MSSLIWTENSSPSRSQAFGSASHQKRKSKDLQSEQAPADSGGNDSSFFTSLLNSATATTAGSLNSQVTDKLVEKFILMALPSDESKINETHIQQRIIDSKDRPQFSVQIMSKNFINMNSRLSIPFTIINQILKIANWENNSLNIFLLILVTNLILTPIPLICSLPIFYIVYQIMVPMYLQKYPPDLENFQEEFHLNNVPYPSNLPISSVEETKPCSQFSKEFFLNMTDLQNFMIIYIVAWDNINKFLSSFIYFKNESFSYFIFVALSVFGMCNLLILPKIIWYFIPTIKIALIIFCWLFMIWIHPNNREAFFKFFNLDTLLDFDEDIKDVDHSTNKEIFSNNDDDEDEEADQNSAEIGDATVGENATLLTKNTKRERRLSKIMKNIANKEKVLDNFKNFENKLYYNLISKEFDYKDFYEIYGDYQEYKRIEIFEIQSYNKEESEWNASIYSPDFFTKNCEIRKNALKNLKVKKKIQMQNHHIDKTFQMQKSIQSSDSTSKASSELSASSDIMAKMGDVDEHDDSLTSIKPASYAHSLNSITPPTNYKFVSNKHWQMDLKPEVWCRREFITDIVKIDDGNKWVFDVDGKGQVSFEFRRRRWTRVVARVTNYDLSVYNGNDYEYFAVKEEDSDTESIEDTPRPESQTQDSAAAVKSTSITKNLMNFLDTSVSSIHKK